MSATLPKPTLGERHVITISSRARPSWWTRFTASTIGVWIGRLLVVAVALGAWQLVGSISHQMNLFVSRPSEVARTLVQIVQTSAFWSDAVVSGREMIIGFAISAVAGSACGFALAQSQFAHKIFDPLITALNSLPRIALASVFILIFGLGQNSKIALVVSLVFFIFLINIYQGASSVNEEWAVVMRTMGANRLQFIRKVTLQSTVPWALASARLGLSQAIAGVIVAEMLAAQKGLGAELVIAGNSFDSARQFAILVFLLIVAMILNQSLAYPERRTRSWSSAN